MLLGHLVCFRIGPGRGPERAGICWDTPTLPPSPGGVWKSPEHLQKKDRFLFSKVKEAAGALPTFKGESAAAKVGFCGCIPGHSTIPGLHLLVVRSSTSLPTPSPPSFPVCPSCFLSASLPALPKEAHQVLGLGTVRPHSPLASQGFQNYLEREQMKEGHSSGFWEGCKQK